MGIRHCRVFFFLEFGKCVENASLEPFFEKQPSIKVPETNDSSSTRKGREVPGSASLASPVRKIFSASPSMLSKKRRY